VTIRRSKLSEEGKSGSGLPPKLKMKRLKRKYSRANVVRKRVTAKIKIKRVKCKSCRAKKVRKKSYCGDENNESEVQVMESGKSQENELLQRRKSRD